MHFALKIFLAIFIAADIAVAAFYAGVRYATPTDTVQVSEDGTLYTGGVVKKRIPNGIVIETAEGEQTFTVTPQTTIELLYTGDISVRNIRTGAEASIVAKGSELLSIIAKQPILSSTSTPTNP